MKLGNQWAAWVLGVAAAISGGCAMDATGEQAEQATGNETDPGAAIGSQEQAASPAGAYGWAAVTAFEGVIDNHTYNSSGGAVTVSNPTSGNYTVIFAGLQAKIPSGSGYPMVSGRGTEKTRCKVREWRRHTNSMQVDVRCHNMSGMQVNSPFFVSVYDRSTNQDTGAYAVVILSTNSPAIDTPRSWTSGGAMSVQRQAAGLYRVFMPGTSKGEGAAFVSAIQNNGNYCKVHDLIAGLTDATVQIACYNLAGTARVDESFVVDFVSAHGRAPGSTAFIHTLASAGATAPNKTGAYNDMEATVSTARPNAATPFASFNFPGNYTTWFPQIRPFNNTYWHATATGTDNTFCKPDGTVGSDGFTPLGTKVGVICMNPSGTLTNGRYFAYMGFDLAAGPI